MSYHTCRKQRMDTVLIEGVCPQCGELERNYLDLIRAHTRRKVESGKVVDLDALARQLRDVAR